MPITVGAIRARCPECEEEIEIPVQSASPHRVASGALQLSIKPDLAEIQRHLDEAHPTH
ncbi:hypothetical protein [Streptomyces sp. NPDC058268]|uniref:hypothetical protein n=1 Tax=Streptomyces sp. NPDC058268 TaxID=3346413 RepID=UPI0036E6F2B0